MTMAARTGSAVWNGGLVDGSGRLTVGDDRWSSEFSFHSRFDAVLPGAVAAGDATNPEELLAAAHAACFSMALSLALSEGGFQPRTISTQARVDLRVVDGLPTIQRVDLHTEAVVPGVDDASFQATAEAAKASCIVSRALAGVEEISLSATLRP
jgi:osmotically inducible protein OsmC